MVTDRTDRVSLIPQKFWSATRTMSAEEKANLVEHLMSLSEVRDFEALQKFDFIVIETHRRSGPSKVLSDSTNY
jgi:hypothetical protein